jgi:hypothetical protein
MGVTVWLHTRSTKRNNEGVRGAKQEMIGYPAFKSDKKKNRKKKGK